MFLVLQQRRFILGRSEYGLRWLDLRSTAANVEAIGATRSFDDNDVSQLYLSQYVYVYMQLPAVMGLSMLMVFDVNVTTKPGQSGRLWGGLLGHFSSSVWHHVVPHDTTNFSLNYLC